MGFTKDKFALFFSLPMTEADYANLDASGVKLVMLPMSLANNFPDMLWKLAQRNVKVVIRVEEQDYYNDNAPTRILITLNKLSTLIPIVAVICGVEPENGINFEYGSPEWAGSVWEHKRRFDAVCTTLQNNGYRVVSPGWTSRAISEDDKPQPGSTTWDEILRSSYNAAFGNGGHIYEYGFDGPVDMIRFKTTLREIQRVRHKPIWLDEVGVSGGDALYRMRAYIEIADMLLTHRLGNRVEMLCPFISGGDPGNPPVWPAGFLMKDIRAYQLLGAWMRS